MYSGFHFLCSKRCTVAGASSFALKFCRTLGKNLSWCAPLSPPKFEKESEKEALFLANPLSSFPPFAGATLGHNITNPQLTVVLWPCRAAPMRYNSKTLGWAYSRVLLSVWPLAVLRLVFTDTTRLTGWENAPLSFLFAFSVTNGSKTSEIWRRKDFLLVCIRKACMLRYCTHFSQLGENSSAGHAFTLFFQNTPFSLFDLSWKAVIKSKNTFNNNLRQALLSSFVYSVVHFYVGADSFRFKHFLPKLNLHLNFSSGLRDVAVCIKLSAFLSYYRNFLRNETANFRFTENCTLPK